MRALLQEISKGTKIMYDVKFTRYIQKKFHDFKCHFLYI